MGAKDRMSEALTGLPDVTDKTGATGKPVKTYYLSDELISHIKRLAQEWNTNDSAVVRWLLEFGLEAVKKGKTPPMETVTITRIKSE